MAGNIEIRFPEDQQEGTEATVTAWLVAEGDNVAAHDPVVEIETDKVVVEVAAPEAGVIAHIKIQQDEEVNPGDVLCILDTAAEAGTSRNQVRQPKRRIPKPPATEISASDAAGRNSRLSPAVRQRVLQHDLDISGIAGSGKDGRITLQDVEALIADQGRQAKPCTTDVNSRCTSGRFDRRFGNHPPRQDAQTHCRQHGCQPDAHRATCHRGFRSRPLCRFATPRSQQGSLCQSWNAT